MNTNLQKLMSIAGENLSHGAREYSPLALAYIGDAVYEMFIRTYVINKGNAPVNKMHKTARELVRASAQAKLYYFIEKELTEEEENVLRRGRNAKSFSTPKNGDVMEYRHATGLEALIGYLYIDGKIDRIAEIIDKGLKQLLSLE